MKHLGLSQPILLLVALSLLYLVADVGAIETVDKELMFGNEEWKAVYDAYTIDPDALGILQKKVGEKLKIDVYLGTWCSDSRDHVPCFIKIIEALNNPNVEVSYFNVESKDEPDVKFYIEEYQIDRLPTFVFYRNGKEIGRVVERPQGTLMQHILKIL
ncbi:thioredoxin family protein [candidate division KSB1 bacterium]|nr:thioredoxin family protein [candidate division KSB1 bacterium]